MTKTNPIRVFELGVVPYETAWRAMKTFTDERTEDDPDELWVVEHPPVFTQGQAGKAEHVLKTSNIPIVQTDRGGQVTYHGPGQLVIYPLINLRRRGLGVRDMVSALENTIIDSLLDHGLNAHARPDAPGVYVEARKIASLGLRVRKGASYHGVAYNVSMDLSPFGYINPCGYAGLTMTDLSTELATCMDPAHERERVVSHLTRHLNHAAWFKESGLPASLTDTSSDVGSLK
ncbi:lipoyl(octanoyl) transferase LipB [Larsenimonas salina]|uniref:lipoyl(octanoyl) transferase LipB n=1 Tax=Larsenimonas salina TaxID=1295565 RepID=UPI002072B280|nr:lipoyl(octanoyl) transferase LipB [Larsenimonas salina]MCM5703362.1 lipoyl(octanoyl) transferase LipB [Larsenimonas salina]